MNAHWVNSNYGHGIKIKHGDEFDTYKLPDGHEFTVPNTGPYAAQEKLLRMVCAEHGIELDEE